MSKDPSIDYAEEFKLAMKVAQLDGKTIKQVVKDTTKTNVALGLILVGSFAAAMGSIVFPIHYGLVLYRPTWGEAIFNALGSFVFVLGAIYVVNFIADRLFSGTGSFRSLLRVVGYGHVVGLLYLFPILTLLVAVWLLVIVGKALVEVKKLTPEQSVLALLFLAIVFIVLFSVFPSVDPDSLYGGLYVVPLP